MTIYQLINNFVKALAYVNTQKELNAELKKLYKVLTKYSESFKKDLLRDALARAKKSKTLTTAQAVVIAHSWNILTARYDKKMLLIYEVYDLEKAIDSIPHNITKKLREQSSGFLNSDDYEGLRLDEYMKKLKPSQRWGKQIETLRRAKRDQTQREVDFADLPSDEEIIYIAQPELANRSDACHKLHGTIFESKDVIPNWAKPLLHINCKCTLKPLSSRMNEFRHPTQRRYYNCDTLPPRPIIAMLSYSDASKLYRDKWKDLTGREWSKAEWETHEDNKGYGHVKDRSYGQGLSNVKLGQDDIGCYYEYKSA